MVIDNVNLHKSLWDITTQELVQVYRVDTVVKADLQGRLLSEMSFFLGFDPMRGEVQRQEGIGKRHVALTLDDSQPSRYGDKQKC